MSSETYMKAKAVSSSSRSSLKLRDLFASSSVANLVSEILDLVSPKDFGMT